jgi:hypothetical protein
LSDIVATPSVVVRAPFVSATGVPELNVIPAFVPKYQLDVGPTCENNGRFNNNTNIRIYDFIF